MILVGNARGGGADLARHLMKEENDHAEVHELRGFVSDTLPGAFNEIYATSRGTKCRQYLYSLSLNPPETEWVETATFVETIDYVEKQLGLEGQPRAVVFHEKNGRRHAHAVWSRINVQEMKAVQLSFDHKKLKSISRELFLEHSWKMPAGLARDSERDPLNFTLAEWQQAKRTEQNARDIKAAIQDAWAISDNRASFVHALEDRGFKLARGDKGRFVAVDHYGEVYSIPRQAGVKTKAVRERLGDELSLQFVNDVKAQYASAMSGAMDRHKKELRKTTHIEIAELKEERNQLVDRQRADRSKLVNAQIQRQQSEAAQRQARFRKGLSGLWDRLRGEHKRIREQNEREAQACANRDMQEKDTLIFNQLNQRRMLKARALTSRQHYIEQRKALHKDQERFKHQKSEALEDLKDEFSQREAFKRKRRQPQTHTRNRGPDLGR